MSSNPQKMDPEEKPGTSASFYGDQGGAGDGDEVSSDNQAQVSDSVSETNSVKIRNASRERPNEGSPTTKRLRIADKDEDDDGIHMDTDTSEDGENNIVEGEHDEEDDSVEMESGIAKAVQPDSIPILDSGVHEESQMKPGRRSSNADESVSTTMQSSSLRYRSLFGGDQTDSSTARRPQLGDAIASTSAAAMAPTLSRSLEESSVIDELYRLPVFESAEGSQPQHEESRRSVRERTPATGSGQDIDDLYFQRKDVNENTNAQEFLQKLHGKQRMMWARKIFFLSTELVFPGFTAYSDNKNQIPDYLGVRVRSSCTMQALLYADSLFFVMWILSFLSTSDILITVLKELHGYLAVCLTGLFILVNILRLRFGLKGNENDEVQYLALFWMTTVIVQIPLFTFIFLTDLFSPVLMAFTVTMDGVMVAFILLESVVGFIHFRSLLRDELNVIRMARRSKEASQSRSNIPTARLDSSNTGISQHNLGVSKLEPSNVLQENSHDSSSDAESDHENLQLETQRQRLGFQMHIQRLSSSTAQGVESRQTVEEGEDNESDSSEQVSSTSDAIRQRPIVRAH
ncbi:Transmembrane protein [Orchesella cincta]|uniref:Transmembrane protein n=1 Tax=Orchesella cincta TaxID=48709 RepID=A0A1D2N132_ORCCI|nr:Transmembrane protein [Orchesella cincta]